MSQSSQPQQSDSAPLQPGYLPTGKGPTSTDMLIKFADGEKVLPAWIVAHHGGNAEVEKIRGELAGISQADFVRAFFDEAGANQLSALHKGIVAGHIGRLNHQQRFKLGR